MPAGQVTGGVDHHHQDRTDTQWSERAGTADGSADSEEQKECANCLDRVLHAPASAAHGHGRVSAGDYLTRRLCYDHVSKNYGPLR
jgi:hypothetical protein